ncbi:MAG: DUF2255 family protein [Myxococcota bacterium]
MSVLLRVCLAFGLLAAPAAASEWTALADADVVRIVTTDEDGSKRSTKIWIVVRDGAAYVRTGATRWFGNLERDPDVLLLDETTERRARAERVTAAERIGEVQAAFREKYGFMDRVSGWIRIGGPRIFELVPRD